MVQRTKEIGCKISDLDKEPKLMLSGLTLVCFITDIFGDLIGDWVNDKKDGKGKLNFNGKETYEGNFKADQKSGTGVFTTEYYSYEGTIFSSVKIIVYFKITLNLSI